jgi:FKBP-type peptidyl-prolyl cis-trans isomerase SlyD
MRIEKDSVVSLNYRLSDLAGKIMEEPDAPISYLHGGYDGIFPMVEEELHRKEVGYSCSVLMEPENTFGEYDSDLVRVEPRDLFPDNVTVGMQFEGGEEGSDDAFIYTVTDIAEDKVVVDGNHPFAGVTLRFDCTVTAVRPATAEELAHGHVHGAHGHEH